MKKSDGERTLVDVNQMIRELLGFVQPELSRHQVVVEEDLADGLAPVQADRIQLQQFVLNVIMNGIEAMAEVTTRERRLVISCGRGQGEAGPGVLVAVQDAGSGAAVPDLERLFDPFFTTKRSGLGLGLAIARHIVDLHHGEITAESDGIGKGATFIVTLPVMAQQPLPFKERPEGARATTA